MCIFIIIIIFLNPHTLLYHLTDNQIYMTVIFLHKIKIFRWVNKNTYNYASKAKISMIFYIFNIFQIAKKHTFAHMNILFDVIPIYKPYQTKCRDGLQV